MLSGLSFYSVSTTKTPSRSQECGTPCFASSAYTSYSTLPSKARTHGSTCLDAPTASSEASCKASHISTSKSSAPPPRPPSWCATSTSSLGQHARSSGCTHMRSRARSQRTCTSFRSCWPSSASPLSCASSERRPWWPTAKSRTTPTSRPYSRWSWTSWSSASCRRSKAYWGARSSSSRLPSSSERTRQAPKVEIV